MQYKYNIEKLYFSKYNEKSKWKVPKIEMVAKKKIETFAVCKSVSS